jgi:hypothetical protein
MGGLLVVDVGTYGFDEAAVLNGAGMGGRRRAVRLVGEPQVLIARFEAVAVTVLSRARFFATTIQRLVDALTPDHHAAGAPYSRPGTSWSNVPCQRRRP